VVLEVSGAALAFLAVLRQRYAHLRGRMDEHAKIRCAGLRFVDSDYLASLSRGSAVAFERYRRAGGGGGDDKRRPYREQAAFLPPDSARGRCSVYCAAPRFHSAWCQREAGCVSTPIAGPREAA
jgi:hypothetical protein